MKKSLLVLSALMLLASCTGGESSSSSSKSGSSSGSSASSSVTQTSSSSDSNTSSSNSESSSQESSSTQSSSDDSSQSSDSSSSEDGTIAVAKVLNYFKSGYKVQTTWSKKDKDDSTNETSKYYEDAIGDGVVKTTRYNDAGFTKKYSTKPVNQYQKLEDGKAGIVSLSLDGKASYTNLTLEDTRTSADVEVTWGEAGFENAFKLFAETDFVLSGATLTLIVPDTQSEAFETALMSLRNQLYGEIKESTAQSMEYVHNFIDVGLTSFSVTIDETTGKPLTYVATLEDGLSYTGEAKYENKFTGAFTAFGDEIGLSKLSAEATETDTVFGAAMTKLQAQNWEVSYSETVSGYYSDSSSTGTGKTNGNILEITNTSSSTTKIYGYKKLTAESYRKYTADGETYTYSGDAINKTWLGNVLPSFKLSSVFFTKDTSASDKTIYTYIGNDLLSGYPKVDVFSGFAGEVDATQTLETFTITITDTAVTFKNAGGTAYSSVTSIIEYSNFGNVTLNRTIAEASAE